MSNPQVVNQDYELEKDAMLNLLKEEWNNIKIKSEFIMKNDEIIKEIFATVKNRLEIDPLITKKLGIKKPQENTSCTCVIY